MTKIALAAIMGWEDGTMQAMRTVLASLLLLAACGPDAPTADAGPGGGGGGGGGGDGGDEVKYTITCNEVLCPGANDSVFRVERGSCTWNCATYEGQSNRRVVLDFRRRVGCWQFSVATVSDGSCSE